MRGCGDRHACVSERLLGGRLDERYRENRVAVVELDGGLAAPAMSSPRTDPTVINGGRAGFSTLQRLGQRQVCGPCQRTQRSDIEPPDTR